MQITRRRARRSEPSQSVVPARSVHVAAETPSCSPELIVRLFRTRAPDAKPVSSGPAIPLLAHHGRATSGAEAARATVERLRLTGGAAEILYGPASSAPDPPRVASAFDQAWDQLARAAASRRTTMIRTFEPDSSLPDLSRELEALAAHHRSLRAQRTALTGPQKKELALRFVRLAAHELSRRGVRTVARYEMPEERVSLVIDKKAATRDLTAFFEQLSKLAKRDLSFAYVPELLLDLFAEAAYSHHRDLVYLPLESAHTLEFGDMATLHEARHAWNTTRSSLVPAAFMGALMAEEDMAGFFRGSAYQRFQSLDEVSTHTFNQRFVMQRFRSAMRRREGDGEAECVSLSHTAAGGCDCALRSWRMLAEARRAIAKGGAAIEKDPAGTTLTIRWYITARNTRLTLPLPLPAGRDRKKPLEAQLESHLAWAEGVAQDAYHRSVLTLQAAAKMRGLPAGEKQLVLQALGRTLPQRPAIWDNPKAPIATLEQLQEQFHVELQRLLGLLPPAPRKPRNVLSTTLDAIRRASRRP